MYSAYDLAGAVSTGTRADFIWTRNFIDDLVRRRVNPSLEDHARTGYGSADLSIGRDYLTRLAYKLPLSPARTPELERHLAGACSMLEDDLAFKGYSGLDGTGRPQVVPEDGGMRISLSFVDAPDTRHPGDSGATPAMFACELAGMMPDDPSRDKGKVEKIARRLCAAIEESVLVPYLSDVGAWEGRGGADLLVRFDDGDCRQALLDANSMRKCPPESWLEEGGKGFRIASRAAEMLRKDLVSRGFSQVIVSYELSRGKKGRVAGCGMRISFSWAGAF